MEMSAVKVESGAEEGKPAPESVPFAPRMVGRRETSFEAEEHN